MPRRSEGCDKCRQRRVKCDGRKPECQRCNAYGVQCPGYQTHVAKEVRIADNALKSWNKCYPAPLQSNAVTTSAEEHSGMQGRYQDLRNISHNAMHRAQLLSTFLDLCLPREYDKTLTSSFAYFVSLPSLDLSAPLLQVSVDALCLAEVGSLYHDDRCILESQARYVQALHLLAREIAKPSSQRMRKDHVLAAITVLAACELYDAISQTLEGGRGWISHVNGAQQYLRIVGPEAVDSRIGRLLLHANRSNALAMGTVRREASLFAEEQWLNFTASMPDRDAWSALFDIVIQLPGLLEGADQLKTSDNLYHDVETLCRDIYSVRASLDIWLVDWLGAQVGRLLVVDMHNMGTFAAFCPSDLFKTVYSFTSVQICQLHQICWISQLMLDFTLMSTCKTYSAHVKGLAVINYGQRSQADLERDMYVTATNLCRSMPYCCEPAMAAVGRVGPFLLRVAISFFAQYGHWAEHDWAQSIDVILESVSTGPAIPVPVNQGQGIGWDPEKQRMSRPISSAHPSSPPCAMLDPPIERYLNEKRDMWPTYKTPMNLKGIPPDVRLAPVCDSSKASLVVPHANLKHPFLEDVVLQ